MFCCSSFPFPQATSRGGYSTLTSAKRASSAFLSRSTADRNTSIERGVLFFCLRSVLKSLNIHNLVPLQRRAKTFRSSKIRDGGFRVSGTRSRLSRHEKHSSTSSSTVCAFAFQAASYLVACKCLARSFARVSYKKQPQNSYQSSLKYHEETMPQRK